MLVNHRYVVVIGVGQNMQNGILLSGEMDCGNNLTKTIESSTNINELFIKK